MKYCQSQKKYLRRGEITSTVEGQPGSCLKGRYGRRENSVFTFVRCCPPFVSYMEAIFFFFLLSLGKVCCLKQRAAKRSLIMNKFQRVSDVGGPTASNGVSPLGPPFSSSTPTMQFAVSLRGSTQRSHNSWIG